LAWTIASTPPKGQQQPAELVARQPLAEQQRREGDEHERLRVVDRRGDRDGCMRVGGEQQQPVEHQGDAAEQR